MREPARAFLIALPTSVEPVNAILSIAGVIGERRARGAVAGDDVHHARRQVGLGADLGQRSAESGVVSAGLSTIVLPAASAGAIFHAAISSGKFHGTIEPTTPSAVRLRAAARGVLELVGPARVVEEVRRGHRHVEVARFLDRLAVVERLERRRVRASALE
jgi:hypothetical protein